MITVETKKQNINKKEFIAKLANTQKLSLEQVEIGVDGIIGFLSSAFKEDCTIGWNRQTNILILRASFLRH